MKTTSRTIRSFLSIILLTGLCAPLVGRAGLVAAWGDNTYGQCTLPNGLTNVKAIAAGQYHNLALRSDGTVAAWGSNDYGQSNVPAGLTSVAAISAGAFHSLALKTDGTIVAWGRNSDGQTQVPAGLSNVIAIAAGGGHNLALRADGKVVAWGNNYFGVTNVPAGLSNVTAIAAGGHHNLALRADGRVVAWGGPNNSGETNVPPGLSDVIAIATKGHHNLALRADGTVSAWGYAEQGQIDVPPGLSNVVKIAAGIYQSLALKADDSVAAWGLDDWPVANLPPGMMNVTALAGGYTHALALVSSGPVQILENPESQALPYLSNLTFSVVATGAEPLGYRWFRNGAALANGGRVSGANTATLSITELQFADIGTYTVLVSNALGSVISSGATLAVVSPPFITSQSADRTVSAGADVTLQVSANGTPPLNYQWFFNGTILHGRTSSILTLLNAQPKDSGAYSLLVSNQYGTAQADIELTVTNSAPYILQQPFVLLPNQSITFNPVVPVGVSVTFRLNARGSTPLSYQWRFNGEDIPGATNATLMMANARYDQTGYYSVAVRNAFGEVISGKSFLNVVQVLTAGAPFAGNTNMPLGLSNVTALAAGGSHIMALKADGTVRTWLANPNFIFGSHSVTNVPASATNVVAIASGHDHCLALRSNGTVVAWGLQGPHVNVPVGLSNVVAVAAGSYRSYAVKVDGTVTGWGSSVTVPAGLSNVVAIAAGPSQNLALRRDGTVAFWLGSASSFTVVPGLSNAIAIVASSSGNRALRQDGTVVAWPASSASQPTPVIDGKTPVTNAVAIAVGSGGTSLILKQDGTLVAAGFPTGAFPFTNNITAIAAGGVQSGFGVLLTGNGAPAITLHPVSRLVQKGDTVQLHSRAAGAPLPPAPREPVKPPMSFQWQHDGVNLPGATNASLVLSNVLGRDTGGYRLIASNVLGMATSRVAALTIPFSTNLPAALNATNLTWTTFSSTSQTNGWFAQIRETHDGDAAAQSGAITHNQQSVLQTTVTGPGTLSFWWKVSSEAGYDFLRFYWNNLSTPYASISGETGWQQISITLGAGTHTLRWTYAKDATVSSGADAGWLDEVTFIPPLPVILRHPFIRTVWLGSTVTIPMSASSVTPVTFQWLKNGTNLPGANAQYLTLTNVTLADAGTYAVKVSNAGGSVISSNAVLTVLAPQPLSSPVCLADGSVRMFAQQTGGEPLQASDASRFSVFISSNLTEWHVLPDALVVTNGHLMLHDRTASNSPARFYRLVEH